MGVTTEDLRLLKQVLKTLLNSFYHFSDNATYVYKVFVFSSPAAFSYLPPLPAGPSLCLLPVAAHLLCD